MEFNLLRKHDLVRLGMLVVAEHPSIAAKLLTSPTTPQEKDIRLVSTYYDRYKKQCASNAKTELWLKKVFICSMIHLYQPVLFNNLKEGALVKYGLLREISTVIKMDKGNASQLVREVVASYKVYEDFRDDVDRAVKEVRNG